MKPDSRYSLAEHKVDLVLEMLRGRSQGILPYENDRLLIDVLDDLANAMEELRAAHEEVDAQREQLAEASRKVQGEHQRYVELFEDAPVGYVVTDLHGVIMQANRAAVELLKSARDFIVGQPLAVFVNKGDKKAFCRRLNEMDALEAVKDWELRLQSWKGKSFWASINITKVQISEHEGIRRLRWLIRNITQRKQMEEELRRSRDELGLRVHERTAALEKANEELRQIPSKLIAVQEEERKRLASELHDSIGQTLAAVKFWVEMALKLKDEGDGNGALNHLEQFVPILQRSIEETRSIYMGLRPSILDSNGLLATLEWLRQECMKLYPERHIELEAGIAEEAIPKNLKVSIFRIGQEALNNVANHSKAEWVDISLSKNGGGIELVVSDDGVGMDLDQILQTSTARSLGFTSMRERTELTGGSFSIESAPGEGTTIRAYWPIEAEEQLQKGSIKQ
jgi:PAS domain S-box-containing protein